MDDTTEIRSISRIASSTVSQGTTTNHGPLPDISTLDVPSLFALREAIIERVAELQAIGVAELKQNILEQARALGVTPEEVLGIALGKKPRGRKAKQKHVE